MTIKTLRLLLKSPQEVTGAAVCDYYVRNREFLREFSAEREESFYTVDYQDEMLNNQVQDWDLQTGCRFYICRKDVPDQVIGTIALSNIVKGAFWSCFLGYQLDQDHINQGYMTEATNAVVQFAFDELHLHRIEGNIMPKNTASRAVVEKCHFALEGISKKYLKINGVWEDHIHYVILNDALE
jgi:ribosomal-protein-alanine N-acetyltransferase